MHQHQHQHHDLELNKFDYMPLVKIEMISMEHSDKFTTGFVNLENSATLFEKTLDFYAKNNAFHEEDQITTH